ncbi:PRC-barrel domain-containing protein [Candidatus Pacearchaeota archaeon]|nr:PRC-barrel domain-containing protein [Candidatus Pacearchaeota archaeon]
MLRIKKVSEVVGKKVFTDTGDFFGDVEEGNLVENKVDSWRIRVASSIGSFLGGAKGVIIPHQFVRAIGDVVIVSRSSLPLEEGGDSVGETVDLREERGQEVGI